MSDFERITEWTPAFDKRGNDTKKDYGIHCMDLRFVLKGPKGAVQFLIFTSWYLPTIEKSEWPASMFKPIPADVGYHSPVPQYEGQGVIDTVCPYVEGGACYSDGSSLLADIVFDIFVEHGEEAMWQELEKEYGQIFKFTEEPINE